ncbi:hypothetical protein F2P79_022955 [Pimephales promelas]|nr:hypothetical protein F2P79_022955 [Pimephales promelas]
MRAVDQYKLCGRTAYIGVSGVDEVKSVSVTEGESVTLNTDTEIQTDELIAWRTGHNNLIAKIKGNNFERFRDRLTLNEKTGSLTITNTRTTDSGLYKVTGSRSKTPLNIFNLTVYARLPVPVISRDCSVLRLSPNCSVVCSSVLSVCDATLSWYAGMSVLSSISVCDLSISLSLPLEVEYQDNNTYSCVLNNPVSNQTTHLDINTLCHTCAGVNTAIELGCGPNNRTETQLKRWSRYGSKRTLVRFVYGVNMNRPNCKKALHRKRIFRAHSHKAGKCRLSVNCSRCAQMSMPTSARIIIRPSRALQSAASFQSGYRCKSRACSQVLTLTKMHFSHEAVHTPQTQSAVSHESECKRKSHACSQALKLTDMHFTSDVKHTPQSAASCRNRDAAYETACHCFQRGAHSSGLVSQARTVARSEPGDHST